MNKTDPLFLLTHNFSLSELQMLKLASYLVKKKKLAY